MGGEEGGSFIFRKIDLKSFQDTLDKRLEVETSQEAILETRICGDNLNEMGDREN